MPYKSTSRNNNNDNANHDKQNNNETITTTSPTIPPPMSTTKLSTLSFSRILDELMTTPKKNSSSQSYHSFPPFHQPSNKENEAVDTTIATDICEEESVVVKGDCGGDPVDERITSSLDITSDISTISEAAVHETYEVQNRSYLEKMNIINRKKKMKIKEALERIQTSETKLKKDTERKTEENESQRKKDDYAKTMRDNDVQNRKKWPKNTILITGDSILNNVEESSLRKKFNVKVRSFPGADVRDMYDYIAPLLRKEPKHVILHIGSNDAPYMNTDEILDDILKLKAHIESTLPNAKVYLSVPTPRYDDAKAV